ncbi:transcriptional regulator, LuxR family [Catenulispora acidiphila DSM 44928]|uniref:Transcriptional regulator, LuxR family n=1 Tax=Catenulispora acidiphila (strain DSM 44928 / JCM 14897 / NBRC 102108 / NRRL B-24433 / ID139908) TaxID=479433 RepID=C7PZC4_CATAD|nr:helix-turn-helix transcriptional regulator [Catenulispora acidiphila]ACU71581.1 transcriptional regulator, LuxR family [Catenulispora acidiphila DSM 44928]
MGTTLAERRTDALVDRCHAGLTGAELSTEVLRRLPAIVPVAATFFATVDPATLLFTSASAQEPLGAAAALFLDNEFSRPDVNKFAALAEAPDPVNSLDHSTGGHRTDSPRYREIMAPLGLGDELRAALITGNHCWGVLCLHLEDADAGFSDQDLATIRHLAPHLAEGLRRATVRDAAEAGHPGAPGMLVLDGDLNVTSMSPQAEQWLALLSDGHADTLPVPVHAAAAKLLAAQSANPHPDAGQTAATLHLRTRDGQWLAIHATGLRGPAETQIGVVIEPATPADLGSLLLNAHGLTEAQTRVVALVLRGHSTREIVNRLHISANTVQEHLTAVFDQLGVRSRRELITTVLGHGGQKSAS